MNFENFVTEQDGLIKSGKGLLVRGNLRRLSKRENVPRQYRGAVAKLARRVGLADTSLRLLHAIIHPQQEASAAATDFEQLQYAAALIANGATREALELLTQINVSLEPEVLFYQGLACFTEWKYQESIPFLESFIKHPAINDYQKFMGMINLCSALVSTAKFEEAMRILEILIHETRVKNYGLLNGYALEIKAEVCLWLKDYVACEKNLDETALVLRKSGVNGELWVRKWRAISLLYRGKKASGTAALNATREHAIKNNDWETQRECDLFKSLFSEDSSLLVKVYFGTPFLSYRARVKRIFEESEIFDRLISKRQFIVGAEENIMSPSEITEIEEIDFQNLNLDQLDFKIKLGSLNHSLLLLLARDLYRPARLAYIHEIVFAQAHFNPFTSPHRVRELCRRTRKSISHSALGIEGIQLGYRLKFTRPTKIIYNEDVDLQGLEQEGLADWKLHLNHIKNLYPKREFSSRELAESLNCSQRTAQRFLEKLLSKKCILKDDTQKPPLYSLAS